MTILALCSLMMRVRLSLMSAHSQMLQGFWSGSIEQPLSTFEPQGLTAGRWLSRPSSLGRV